ncbi:LPXTG cell wall anchor domain-containing protein [Culicoidibacter larvae]|uniref:LPXTG cell wall anchor domain-containing protein n=1 Tax=Culicoidibacter larvae TaxID=2579976 RepID=A0A5R8Q719_9FIRM|nr:LPXTG cell wall anchor domain-containing protein [Culicoidibacter larvae]TLG71210.1 LPXTG cell wall anchor domain-containing protein [Culicoidibacter larvae]
MATVYLEEVSSATTLSTYAFDDQVQAFNATSTSLQTAINIELYTEPQTALPTTGDDTAMIGIISGTSIISLAGIIIYRRRK